MLLIASPIIGFITALIAVVGLFLALNIAAKSKDGVLKYYFYVIVVSTAVTMLLSSRDFSLDGGSFESALQTNWIANWLTRFASLFTMLAALERAINYLKQNQWDSARIIMLLVLVYFWLTNLFIPLFITAGQPLEIKHFYSLALSIGIALSIQSNNQEIIKHARNAFVLFVLASLVFIFIKPHSALDLLYTQGYIPGLPRFFGLAPHATAMGLFAALAIWLTLCFPYQSTRLNKTFITLCAAALILTQSKTIIFSFIIGSPFIFYYLSKNFTIRSPHKTNPYALALYGYGLLAFIGIIAGLLVAIFIDIQATINQHLSQETIHNLSTLTGRDVIWEIAMAEFYKNPLFGYGANLFSMEFRQSIGLLNATDAHSQFVDALARNGLLGFSGLMLLYGYLIFYAIKRAANTNGLTLTLTLLILLYSVTAVPISLNNIGLNALPYYLLLVLISAGHTPKATTIHKRNLPVTVKAVSHV